MYDTSFDDDAAGLPGLDRRALWLLRIAGVIGVVFAASADAQLPGVPVLQNVWATPGIVGALDIGGGSDGSVYAAAASWTPGSGRFQFSGGAGFATRTGRSSRGAYGVRAAIPLGGASSSFGFAAFAGIGGGSGGSKQATINGTTVVDTVASSAEIPIGASIGWRRAIGSSHGVSVYASPYYAMFTGGTKSSGLFRASVGADVGVTRSIGATVGIEFGATRARGFGGPSRSTYGLGVSYAFGKR